MASPTTSAPSTRAVGTAPKRPGYRRFQVRPADGGGWAGLEAALVRGLERETLGSYSVSVERDEPGTARFFWQKPCVWGSYAGDRLVAAFGLPESMDSTVRQSLINDGWRGIVSQGLDGTEWVDVSLAWRKSDRAATEHAAHQIHHVLRNVFQAEASDVIRVTLDGYFRTVHGWIFDATWRRLTGTGKSVSKETGRPSACDAPAWTLGLTDTDPRPSGPWSTEIGED